MSTTANTRVMYAPNLQPSLITVVNGNTYRTNGAGRVVVLEADASAMTAAGYQSVDPEYTTMQAQVVDKFGNG